MTNSKPKDRISVEEKTSQFYKELNASAVKNSNIIDQPFSEAKDIFMLAVCLGVNSGKRIPLEGEKEGLFFWNRLSNDIEIPALRLIALAETGNVETMQDIASIQQIAEEYANKGIRILMDDVIKKNGGKLFNLIDLVRS